VTTPQETIHSDILDGLSHGFHIGFIVPRLDFKSNGSLGNSLGLVGLSSIVFSNTFSLDSFGFSIFFFVRAKKINIVFINSFSSRSGFGRPKNALLLRIYKKKSKYFVLT
jgi:hypothetical protein